MTLPDISHKQTIYKRKSPLQYILKIVGKYYGLRRESIIGTGRKEAVVKARYLSMYFMWKFLDHRPELILSKFKARSPNGVKDRTCLNKVRKSVDDKLDVDDQFRKEFAEISLIIEEALGL